MTTTIKDILSELPGYEKRTMDGLRIIPKDTFKVLETIEGGRFRSRLLIEGPIDEYGDEELLLHFGGNAKFGDRVDRYEGGKAWVHVWSD